jgi:hypothetical protein
MRGICPILNSVFEFIFSEEVSTFPAILPVPLMLFIVMKMANTSIFMLKVTIASSPV